MKFYSWLTTVQLLIAVVPLVNSENILFFHNIASYSHLVTTWPLAEALSNRGHNITYITPYKYKQPNPNITEILPEKFSKFLLKRQGQEFDINLRVHKKLAHLYDTILDISYTTCEALYTSPDFLDWLKTKPKFDLVIIDSCFDHECGVGLAYKLSAKYIYFSTIPTIPFEYDAFGYLPESSAIPEFDVDSPSVPMNFFTRLDNTLMSIKWRFWHYLHTFRMDNYIRNALEIPDMPFVGDLVSSPTLVFYTGDVILDYPRTLPPNYVNVAGLHFKESSNDLPKDIKEFLGNGEENDGFVYISLGSMVVSSNLPESIKQVFFDTFRSFPRLKFLWKWNGDFPKEIPENLFLRKWYPQIDLLGHEKIRGFITQSGRPSCVEALYNGVPMISFPVLGDQDFNANRLAESGATIKLEIGTVTLKELTEAINRTAYDSSVKSRMNKLKQLVQDRPMSSVDTGVWWTEYVLRMDDTEHLSPAGAKQNWFVRRQIDVWAFLSIGVFIMLSFVGLLIFKIIKKFLSQEKKLKTL